jgi:hypothetical protein
MILGEQKFKEVTIEATIIRADGSKVPLGVIAYYHKNPVKRWVHALKQKITNWRK